MKMNINGCLTFLTVSWLGKLYACTIILTEVALIVLIAEKLCIYITIKKTYETKAVCMFFKHIFGVSVWLDLVIRYGIKTLYFDCILGNLLHYFNGTSIVNF